MGIPISEISQTTTTGQFRLKLDNPKAQDYLLLADSFHVAKWLIKHVSADNGYYANFTPLSDGVEHDVTLLIDGVDLGKVNQRLPLYLPNINSMRRFLKK
jgi:hypothetical protein